MAVDEGSALYHVSSVPSRLEIQSDNYELTFLRAPYYEFKIFRSKGAVLVLLWSFAALFVFQFSTIEPDRETSLNIGDNNVINPEVIFIMCMLLYPILGWLGDVKYGRYRVMRGGLWTSG